MSETHNEAVVEQLAPVSSNDASVNLAEQLVPAALAEPEPVELKLASHVEHAALTALDKHTDINHDFDALDIRITSLQINRIVDEIRAQLSGRPLSKLNMLRCAAQCVSVTKKMAELPNNLKKKVILVALERIINEQVSSQDDRDVLLLALADVDSGIDLIVDVQKGRVAQDVQCCTIV